MMEKYKVIATIEQLRTVGLGEDEFEEIGDFVIDYGDGWICLKIKSKTLDDWYNDLDFPKNYIEPYNPQHTEQLNKD